MKLPIKVQRGFALSFEITKQSTKGLKLHGVIITKKSLSYKDFLRENCDFLKIKFIVSRFLGKVILDLLYATIIL